MMRLKMMIRLFKLFFYVYILIYFYMRDHVYADRAQGPKNPHATVTLGLIFEKDSDEVQNAFKTAMMMYNSKKAPTEFQLYIDVINTADVYKLSRLICNQYTRGAVAMLGSVPSDSFDTLHSYANTFQMPFITPWFPEKVLSSISGTDYAVSLRPDYHRAIMDTIRHYGWSNIIYIYDSHDGLLRLQSMYESMGPGNSPFRITQVKRVAKSDDVIEFLSKVEEVDRWSNKYVVLDSSTDVAKETVINHARSLKLGRRTYHYLLSGFVMDDLWSEAVHEFGTLNITGFRVLDYSSKKVRDFLDSWKMGSHMSAQAAMMFDSVNLVIEAILRLLRKKPEFLRAAARRSVPPNSTKVSDCNIEEKGITPFEYGERLAKMIRKTEIDGLTGFIKFDEDGRRRNFTLRVVQMTTGSNLETVGTWYDDKGLSTLNPLRWMPSYQNNKTYIITTIDEDPYVIPIVDYTSKTKYKGFCVDLAKLIMEKLELKYEMRLVKDGKYGQENPDAPGGWDGIIGELVRKEADLSISSLTVTVDREEAVDFSKTFLSFDTVPQDVPSPTDTIFTFLLPLSKEVWLAVLGSLLAVSFCLYLVSKYSPDEYQLHLKTNRRSRNVRNKPQATFENTFTLWNALWFAVGSFMQQSSGYTPRSLSGRIISGVWWFVTLFIIVIYTANLATHLTLAQLQPPLNPVHRVTKCPIENTKPCEMLISVMESGLQDFAVAFPKGSPLRDGVNMALQTLRNEGELYRLIRKWFIPLTCNGKNHGKELTLSQIAGLFYILLAGLGLGLVTSFIEYLVHRKCAREAPPDISPPGTPIRTPSSPTMRTIKSTPHRTLREREPIDWNAVNYTYGSPTHQPAQEETVMHGTFRQV
ncbi:glutamate receptor 1-like [Colias croceus]|uniref:glutamate receptor 1-like n=1 Tax=Colias crocea TaxID=72248 RepID=UPI001E279ED3|nr:glutamate receptor 1-like [Colias croceus]